MAAGVLAPQAADDVHRLGGAGGEFEPGVHRRTGVQAEVLGGEPAPQPAGEHLGDQRGGGAPGLLAAQPAGHRRLVVAQVEAVLDAELIDSSGQSCIGEPRFGDQRGELAVGRVVRGSFRHRLYRSPAFRAWPPGSAHPVRHLLALVGRRECNGLRRLSDRLCPAFIRSCEQDTNGQRAARNRPPAAGATGGRTVAWAR